MHYPSLWGAGLILPSQKYQGWNYLKLVSLLSPHPIVSFQVLQSTEKKCNNYLLKSITNKISLCCSLETLFPRGWVLSVSTEEQVGAAFTLSLPWDMDTASPLGTDLQWSGEWPCWAPESHWWSGMPASPRLETTSGQCGNGEVPLQNQISSGSIKTPHTQCPACSAGTELPSLCQPEMCLL